MNNDYVFVTDESWFESTSLKNPVIFPDHKLEKYFPGFYSLNYDPKLLATKPATKTEREAPFYNDYREKYGASDLSALTAAVMGADARNLFLNGLTQTHFESIVPYIKDSAEVLYFFKCPKICDLSALSEFPRLRCVLIYWNHSLEDLWDMTNNGQLQVISFVATFKLRNLEALSNSSVEYVNLDSSDNYGHRKKSMFDHLVFERMPRLKHLSLTYDDCQIDF